jgi:type IV pilus assembly protein PilC
MSRLSLGKLSTLFRRIATATQAGIDPRTTWTRERDLATGSLRAACDSVVQSVSQGDSIAEGMEASRGAFPPMVVQMTHIGEKTGRLEVVFEKLAHHFENLIRMRRVFITGLTWPAIELGMSILIIGLLIIVLGWVAETKNAEPVDLLGMGLGTTGSLIVYVLFLTMIASGIGLVFYAIRNGLLGDTPMRIALKIPVVGKTIEFFALSRMAWSLGMAHDAGMSAIESMRLGLRSTQIAFFARHEDQVADILQSGKEMHEALTATRAFPGDFVQALAVGEISGSVTESMERLSQSYQNQAEQSFQRLTIIGGFLVMMLVFGIIIFAIFYLFFTLILPAYTITQ